MRHQYSPKSSRSPNLLQLGRQKCTPILTKVVNLASRCQLPELVAPILCSATLTALKKLKGGVRPTAVGEFIQRLIAKCIAREANSETADLFNTKQLGVAVKGVDEGIVHATKVSFKKLQKNFRNIAD